MAHEVKLDDQRTLIERASVFQYDNLGPGDDGYVLAENAIWGMELLPVSTLIHLMPSRGDWIRWFKEELEMDASDYGGTRGWADLLVEPIHEEIVVTLIDNKAYIWDGWHRAAASIASHRDTVPALVGRPKETPVENEALSQPHFHARIKVR